MNLADLDPDRLAALEEERDFLLRSLDDLEREHEVGDVDDDDYRVLRDDYTVRAAAAIRSIDARRVRAAESKRGFSARSVLVGLGVLAFAGVAGLLVARTAGQRNAGESATGEVRASVRTELATCLNEAAAGQVLASLECYDAILERQPTNAEALTYRGWVLVRTGDPELIARGTMNIDQAIAADPEFADARAFRAVLYVNTEEGEAAQSELDALDELDPSPIITDLLEERDIQGRTDALLE